MKRWLIRFGTITLCLVMFLMTAAAVQANEISGEEDPETEETEAPVMPEAPMGVGVVKTTRTSCVLQWEPGTDADQYEVYVCRSGQYEKVMTVAEPRAEITGLKPGTRYIFAIKTIHFQDETWISSVRTTVTVRTKLDAVTGFTAKAAGATKISLSWKPVRNAGAYEVYKYRKTSGTWEKVLTTTRTSAVVSGLVPASQYQFRIRAARTLKGGTVYSYAYRSKSCMTRLAKVTGLTIASANPTFVTLSWDKVPKAQGYEIYRYSKSTGKYTRLGTTTRRAYTIKGLSQGKSYTYAVRAYKKVDNRTIYSTKYARKSFSAGNHYVSGKYEPIYEVQTPKKVVCLTFDSAYGSSRDDKILKILKKYNIKSTFFVTGSMVDGYPDLVRRMIQEGHIIGSHGNTHTDMPMFSHSGKYRELDDLHKKVQKRFGYTMKYARPASGAFDDDTIRIMLDYGYLPIQWSVDSLDWMNMGHQAMIDRTIHNPQLRNGAIILLHTGQAQYTADALETIILQLKAKGYSFVNLDELVRDYDYRIDAMGAQVKK